MKIRDLKELLALGYEGLTDEEFDDLDVLMPLSGVFDGYWRHPCPLETGVAEVGIDGEVFTELAFCIAPHGFYDEGEGIWPELN